MRYVIGGLIIVGVIAAIATGNWWIVGLMSWA